MPRALPWPTLGDPPWAAPVHPRSLPLPRRAETLVVGAGITGLSCALHLTALGRDVVVIDRRFGRGATPRSGGFILGDTLTGPAPGFDGCDAALRTWLDAQAPGLLTWTSCWELDRDPSLAPTPIDWQDSGPVRVGRTIGAGLADPSAVLNTLVSAVADRAPICFDGVDVEAVEGHGTTVLVRTAAGIVIADRVLLCTDATLWPEDDDPWPDRQLTVALETSPIADDLAAAIGWGERRPFYTNDLPLLWGRPLPGGTMLVGRELINLASLHEPLIGPEIARAGARLLRRLHHMHPALGLVSVRRVWAGPIARNASGVPALVADAAAPGVFRLGGSGGHGLAQAFRLGAIAARTIYA